MKTLPIILTLAVPMLAAGSKRVPEHDLGQRVWVSSLTGNVFRVRSISPVNGFGDVESNALVVAGPRESVLIDTPVTKGQTAVILDWAQSQLGHPVRHLIVTHWHSDRMGGIDEAVRRGIATYAFGKTIELAREHHLTPPQQELHRQDSITMSGVQMEFYYPGHGHTVDNLVVWLPREKVLHGGCFVKATAANNLGNTEEIDAANWKSGIVRVRDRYGSAEIVVPGHGDPGGTELLKHTEELLDLRGAILNGRPVLYLAGWKHQYSLYPASARLRKEFGQELSLYP